MIDAVIISDLHLGSDICRVKRLEEFLENLPPTKRLILNGDVLENMEHRLKKHHWRVLSLLRKWSDDLKLVWVEGNHDAGAESLAHMIGASWVPHYHFQSCDYPVVCVHGHQWDDFLTDHPVLTWIADRAYLALQRVKPDWAVLAKKNSKTFLRCAAKVAEEAKAWACTLYKEPMVCCGHTHQPCSGWMYFNSGCWTEPACHYLTVSNGLIELHQFQKE